MRVLYAKKELKARKGTFGGKKKKQSSKGTQL